MKSLILRTVTQLLFPLFLLYSIFLLLAGHHEPGGGFIGGLVAATAFVLYAIAFDVDSSRKLLCLDPRTVIAWGLVAAVSSAMIALSVGKPFMKGLWVEFYVFGLGMLKVGTPLLFDIGVYLVVIGITVLFIFNLAEE